MADISIPGFQLQLPGVNTNVANISSKVYNELPDSVEKRSFFMVTEKVFNHCVQKRYANGIKCTEQEVGLINQHLDLDFDSLLTTEDFKFENDIKCQRCSRQINFYDVFMQGIQKHGIGFMKWAILSNGKKVQMFPEETEQTIVCSQCNFPFVIVGGYNHYFAGSYACV